MYFRLLSDSELDSELLKMLSTEATDFAQGENPKYEGWAIETVECDGAEPAICTNKGKIKNLSYTDSNVGIRPVTKYSESASTTFGLYLYSTPVLVALIRSSTASVSHSTVCPLNSTLNPTLL